MAKPEWGTKRTCPECSTRFYDLGKDEPVTCISCGHAWTPQPLLTSRQHGSLAPKPTTKPDSAAKDGAQDKPDSVDDGSKDDSGIDEKADDEAVPDGDQGDDDPDPSELKDKKTKSKKTRRSTKIAGGAPSATR